MLSEQLEQQITERKREIEYWVSERATMREMIEQLENEKVAQNDGGLATVMPMPGEDGGLFEDKVKQMKKKTQRKLKEKEVEIRT